MASSINASTSGAGGIITTADNTGILNIQTAGTNAITVDASQRAAFVAGTAALPAITTSGDTNTGMFFPAADTIAFSEGGVEVMRINSSGNVGIGVDSTNGKLTVAGNIIPSGAPNTFWGIDYAPVDGTGSSYVTLAFGATYDLASGSGIVFIMENSSSVGVLMAQCAYGGVYIVSDPSARYSTAVNTASKVNLYYNAATGKYRIQNNYSSGTTYSFWVATIRVRATT